MFFLAPLTGSGEAFGKKIDIDAPQATDLNELHGSIIFFSHIHKSLTVQHHRINKKTTRPTN
jgi:hypothetical protein